MSEPVVDQARVQRFVVSITNIMLTIMEGRLPTAPGEMSQHVVDMCDLHGLNQPQDVDAVAAAADFFLDLVIDRCRQAPAEVAP